MIIGDGARSTGRAPLRLRLQRFRRRAARFRLWAGASFTGLSVILSTVYENIPIRLQYVALGLLSASGAVAVLLLEPPEARESSKPGTPRAGAGPTRGAGRIPLPTRPARPGGPSGPGAPERTLEPVRRRLRWRVGRRRVEAVPTLPPRDVLFRGRGRELAELREQHDRQRAARPWSTRRPRFWRNGSADRQADTGPVVLRVHGMPGVGKSALVDELARDLAAQYPHGQVYVSMGTGSAARPPHEILQELLLALGWRNREIPPTTTARATVLRSLTVRKRILFIFDAARNAEQVRLIMPNDPATAVLITSRRDLLWPDHLPTPSYHLQLPSEDDALDMFGAVSNLPDGIRPECVAEIVSYCDRLPLAIRAAAERVADDHADACQIAGLLRGERSRLGWLVRPGRALHGHLLTEYGRLLPPEQEALAMLALIPSATFVPWVLAPMMELPVDEAEALVDRLAAAQLLHDHGMDDVERVARYGFHPLVRLFALEQAARIDQKTVDAAFARLDEAYLDAVAAALTVLNPEFTVEVPSHWLGRNSTLPKRIADNPQRWVRSEYPNLLRLINSARTPDSVRWRIGAWLDGCVPAELTARETLNGYDSAVLAAENERESLGLVDVLLGKGTFLVAIERYADAERTFDRALAHCEQLRRRAEEQDDEAALLEVMRRFVSIRRKTGEAYLQAAHYRQAIEALEDAYRHAERSDDLSEQRLIAERRLIQVLLGEVHHVDTPEAAKDELHDPRVPDATRYRILLSLAEGARRRGDWNTADEYFAETLELVESDQRRRATVQYRMARALLGRALAADGHPDGAGPLSARPGLAVRAARRAASAAVIFQQMGNPVGEVRAYCMLARAVLALHRWVEAERLAHVAASKLDRLHSAGESPEMLAPLAARLDRLRGELRLRAGDQESARHLLMTSAATFAGEEDWAALRDVLRSLEHGRPPGYYRPAEPAQDADDPLTVRNGYPALPAGPVSLSPAATEQLAARVTSSVSGRLQAEIRQALVPAPVAAFRGAVGVHLDGAEEAPAGEGEPPLWRVPVGRRCELTVLVVTGHRPYADDAQRPTMAAPRLWLPAETTGTAAEEVELTVLVDAPFVEVAAPELTVNCPTENARVQHRSGLLFDEPGTHHVRVTLLSSARLVQSLPLRIEAVGDA
ncbi:hypothetical protein GCM10022225_61130 [Plantactinospora mayteni]|uniref:NB-ARC domain-containing protein n=1 Tax=Plantactinospora mayteni TaxID=566021 RepID=A0ABQ4EZW8_9ACTN|nr:tetratricopeptide repeat protein [Plantactinospora mayteni]GIH00145.1 hypothetical protein Pma05_67170 [Plantactinospora mayteni]